MVSISMWLTSPRRIEKSPNRPVEHEMGCFDLFTNQPILAEKEAKCGVNSNICGDYHVPSA